MQECRHCGKPFIEVKAWQVYCSERCQQDWHLHQRKLARQERLLARLKEQEEAGFNGYQRATPEQKEEAKQALAKIIASVSAGVETIKLRRRI